jgi:hypothetical protein
MALVEAARFYNLIEAGLTRGRLEAEDILCILFDTEMNWGGADLGVVPVRLMVDDEDLERARQILERPPEQSNEAE